MILQRLFTKKALEDRTINLGGNRVKMKDMTEKQLENLIHNSDYTNLTDTERKNRRRHRIMLDTASSLTGASIGGAKSGVKGALIGSGIGALVGEGTWQAAKKHHEKHSRWAKEELNRRKGE